MSQGGDVPSGYGEGDTEAKAMDEAAEHGRRTDPAARAKVPPADAAVPAAGTAEVDIAAGLKEKAERESND